jgi:hypothetical protein
MRDRIVERAFRRSRVLPLARLLALAVLAVGLRVSPAGAVPIISLTAPNGGITDLNVEQNGSTLSIFETWGGAGPGFLTISGLRPGISYVVQLFVTNTTAFSWHTMGFDVLDHSNTPNDRFDPLPQPAYVPTGFSTSNDRDGFSFAQFGSIARTSSVFNNVVADELTDARDMLSFTGGSVAGRGGLVSFVFGLRDSEGHRSFGLLQRPTGSSPSPTPEPSSIVLMGIALVGLYGASRRLR